MRLIDADELKKKLKLWAFNNVTTTSPTFDFVTEFDINECPTVDVLDKIRAEIEQAVWEDIIVSLDGTDETRIPRLDPNDVFEIINKYKAENEDKK